MAPFHTYGEHKSILYRHGRVIILSSCIAKQWKTNPGHNKWREKYKTCKTQHKTLNQTNIERTKERQGIQDITQDVKPKHDISWFTFGFCVVFCMFRGFFEILYRVFHVSWSVFTTWAILQAAWYVFVFCVVICMSSGFFRVLCFPCLMIVFTF